MKKSLSFFAIITIAAAFALPASGSEWSFSGAAGMNTFTVNQQAGVTKVDTRNTTWEKEAASLNVISADIKNGDISGFAEIGFNTAAGALEQRYIYGIWNFGKGEILIGHADSVINFGVSNQAYQDDGMATYGGPDAGTNDQIRLSTGRFNLGLHDVTGDTTTLTNTTGAAIIGTAAFGAAPQIIQTFPKIEASYTVSFENFALTGFGGYQNFEIRNTAATKSYDISSYVAGIGFTGNYGPAVFNASFHFGENFGQYGMCFAGDADVRFDAAQDKFIDVDSTAYCVSLAYKASDKMTFEIGYGSQKHELDQINAKSDETRTSYLQAAIEVAPGFEIVPEIGHIDYVEDNTGADEGEDTYAGVVWKISF